MACNDGTWVHMRTVEEGLTSAQVMKCNGCPAWWVILHGPKSSGDAFTVEEADGVEDALRQAFAQRLAR